MKLRKYLFLIYNRIMSSHMPIVFEMKELMEEIVSDSKYTAEEKKIMDEYFTDFFNFVNNKGYKYALDDNGFVIRSDCHANKKSPYGWIFLNNAPHALISKINLRKTKIDIKSDKSIYRKIYNAINSDFDEWINS